MIEYQDKGIIIFRTKDAIKSLKTVEEKMYQINRPKKYGWYSYQVDTQWMPSDVLGMMILLLVG